MKINFPRVDPKSTQVDPNNLLQSSQLPFHSWENRGSEIFSLDSMPKAPCCCRCPSFPGASALRGELSPSSAVERPGSGPVASLPGSQLAGAGAHWFLRSARLLSGWVTVSTAHIIQALPLLPNQLRQTAPAAVLSSSNYRSSWHNKSWSHKCRQICSYFHGHYCA